MDTVMSRYAHRYGKRWIWTVGVYALLAMTLRATILAEGPIYNIFDYLKSIFIVSVGLGSVVNLLIALPRDKDIWNVLKVLAVIGCLVVSGMLSNFIEAGIPHF